MLQMENRQFRSLRYLGVLVVFALATQQVIVNGAMWHQLDSVRDVLKRGYQFLKLDWSGLSNLIAPLGEVVVMAFCGAFAGGLLALCALFLRRKAALFERPALIRSLRWLESSCSAVHELVWALILVSVLGPGLVAGILALGLVSVERLAFRLGATTLDEDSSTDAASVSSASVRLSGAGTASLLLTEGADNLGRAAVLGLVGVGGLGLEFYRNLVANDFGTAAVTLLAVLGLIGSGEALKLFLERRPLQISAGVNEPLPAGNIALSRRTTIQPPGPRPAYGLLSVMAGAIVVLFLHAIGVLTEPRVISDTLELRDGEFLTGLVWSVSETLQMLFVAVALGTLAATLLAGGANARIAGLRGLFRFSSRAIIVLALVFPVMFSVLLCRTVIGVGPLSGVIALSFGAVGLIGRDLVFRGTAEPSNRNPGQERPVWANARLAVDVFARLLPAAAIIGFFGAGGTGWLLKLTMQHGDTSQALSVLIVIVLLMLLSQTGYEGMHRHRTGT